MKTNISKKLTLTIGIPAYNEEANIGHLISDILYQKQQSYSIERIILASDASDDNTVFVAEKFNNPYIKIIKNQIREGVAMRQNQIFSNSTSDVVVLLNADIMIKDPLYIEKLIRPIIAKRADLTSSTIEEMPASNFFEEILYVSMKVKRIVFHNYRKGDNIYTCHGVARGFSKKLYKKLIFKSSIGEDAYSYLYCVFNRYKYEFVENAVAYYKLPTNYIDHEKQSIRFFQSQKKFVSAFGYDLVKKEYNLPPYLFVMAGMRFFFRFPMQILLYVFLYLGIKIKSFFSTYGRDAWDISSSSKLLQRKTLRTK